MDFIIAFSYMYVCMYVDQAGREIIEIFLPLPPWCKGISHSTRLAYLFIYF